MVKYFKHALITMDHNWSTTFLRLKHHFDHTSLWVDSPLISIDHDWLVLEPSPLNRMRSWHSDWENTLCLARSVHERCHPSRSKPPTRWLLWFIDVIVSIIDLNLIDIYYPPFYIIRYVGFIIPIKKTVYVPFYHHISYNHHITII